MKAQALLRAEEGLERDRAVRVAFRVSGLGLVLGLGLKGFRVRVQGFRVEGFGFSLNYGGGVCLGRLLGCFRSFRVQGLGFQGLSPNPTRP